MSESKAREIESYVKKWMAHPENLGTIPTNESGQYIFKNKNNDSINLGVYFEMILSDYIKDHSQQSAEVSEENELLYECMLQLQYLNVKFGETGTTNALLSKLYSKGIELTKNK